MSDEWIESLQQASDNVDKWPDWKRRLAGLPVDHKGNAIPTQQEIIDGLSAEREILKHENAILINALREISSPMYVGGPAWGMREIAAKALKQVEE